jgi:hypothetical protein
MPRTTTVRLAEHSHALLRQMASQEQLPLQEVLERAIEAYRRERILDATNAAYAAVRSEYAYSSPSEIQGRWGTVSFMIRRLPVSAT